MIFSARYFCCILVILSIQNSMFAQGISAKDKLQLDSIDKVASRAFSLCQKSKYGEAVKMAKEVLEYAKSKNNDSLKGRAYSILGWSYPMLGEHAKGLNYLLMTKDIYVKLKDTTRLIFADNDLGIYYRDLDSMRVSNTYFEKAMHLAKNYKNNAMRLYPAYNLGLNFLEFEKDNERAVEYLELAASLVKTSKCAKNNRIVADIYEALGYVYYKLKRKGDSKAYYEKCLEYSKKHGYLEVISMVYWSKSELYKEEGEYEKANEMLYKYMDVNDSIIKVTNYEKVKEVEAEYFIKENKSKLEFIKNEKKMQEVAIKKSKGYNFILIALSLVLFLNMCWIFKKNKALRSARDKAESLSRVKSEFYSEISHELRTPLYAVIELSSLLLRENISVKHKEYLESLKFSGNHLMSLINNVLQLNKVESGTMKVQRLEFDLKNLISNIIDSLEYALRDSNNSISLKYGDNIPKLLVGDSLKLSQVLINLISNAIKFTNDGHIDVVINQVDETESVSKIYFKVSDDGLGIPMEKKEQVFEDFYQENHKNTTSYKGTGLGLSIVKRILTAMDSSIHMVSKENEGATLFFELAFEKSTKSNLPVTVYQNQLEQIKDCHILIVDDNKINQLVTRKILDQLGIKSKTVDSGLKAINMVQEEDFDCILMDLHMPELDGYETTKLIRSFNQNIAIVALTAATSEEVESKIHFYDINGYVLKPFMIDEFVETLNKAIHRSEGHLF